MGGYSDWQGDCVGSLRRLRRVRNVGSRPPGFDVLEQVGEDLDEGREERLGRDVEQRQAVGRPSVFHGHVRRRARALYADVVPHLRQREKQNV